MPPSSRGDSQTDHNSQMAAVTKKQPKKIKYGQIKNHINLHNMSTVIASALTEQEIRRDWLWLFDNVCPTLHSFDTEEEVTEFVCCKINSIIATEQESFTEGKMKHLLIY